MTLDNLPKAPVKETSETTQLQRKQIIITEIGTATREDELELKIGFKPVPSKTAFSKVKLGLWFDNQQIKSALIIIPQGSLSGDELELTPVLDMKGIEDGPHTIRAEMYEPWSNGEKLNFTSREVTV